MNKIELIRSFVKGGTNLKGSNLYTITDEKLGITELINYNTTIAFYAHNTQCVFLNSTKYSVTTSKNQNYIRRYSDKIVELPHSQFMHLLEDYIKFARKVESEDE